MKKKFILIFSMLALVACLFALSVSASNYIDFSEADLNSNASVSFNVYLNTDYIDDDFTSTSEETFGLISYSDSNNVSIFGFYNIEFWHSYLTEQNVKSSSDFATAVYHLIEIGAVCDGDSGIGYEGQSFSEDFYLAYQKYVALYNLLNAPTYEQGKTDGVTEYKTSNEYYAELNKQYAQGKTEGVTAYKSSSEYTNAMNAKYATGLADGEANYIESDEYEEALQAEYDKGLSEAQVDKLGTTLLSIVGSTLLGVAVVWLINRFSSKRKRRR